MTYKEAKQKIDDNEKKLDRYIMHTNPIHMVKGAIVAPSNRDNNIENIIFSECIENYKDNADVLLEMNLFSQDLTPFVVVLYKGWNICWNLDFYINEWTGTNEKNPSS